jgi:CRP-like cAMP-binding protein
MLINCDILIAYGGCAKKYDKDAIIFREGTPPRFLYQIVEGEVKLYSTNNEGKDLIQGLFKAGDSFGEPPLLLNKAYPSTAQTTTPGVIIKITREKLMNILDDYPEVNKKLLYTFAERIYNKATAAQIWLSHTPEEKIIGFLNKVKEDHGETEKSLIPFTRQQIADFTGLRVETVIRTLIRMSEQDKVIIMDHKLYY